MIPPILPKIILALRKDGDWLLEDGLEVPEKALADGRSKEKNNIYTKTQKYLCVCYTSNVLNYMVLVECYIYTKR